jgi:hypothetical protein
MAADCIDDDTEQAVLNLWQQDAAGLMGLFKQLPRTGRLKSTAPGADIQATGPYATVDSQLARREIIAADARGQFGWNDYRNVTITVYGVRADVVKAAQLFSSLFNRLIGTPLGRPFTLPSGARFVRWWPQGDVAIEEDKDSKAGKDVWKAIAKAEVWSVRADSPQTITGGGQPLQATGGSVATTGISGSFGSN